MGYFKILPSKQAKPKSVYEQEFEFKKRYAKKIMKETNPNFLSWVLFFFCFVCAIGAVTYYLTWNFSRKNISLRDSSFELKVISENNSPVAGARVYLDKIKLGVTDSFGEWKKSIPSKPGSNMEFRVKKLVSSQEYFASKIFLIPLTEEKEKLEFTSYIKLPIPEIQKANPVQIAVTKNQNLGEIWFKEKEGLSQSNQILVQKIIGFLKEKSKRSGLVISQEASWQVLIDVLDTKPSNEILLRIVGKALSQEASDFLIKPLPNSYQTAETILQTLKKHTKIPYKISLEDNQWVVSSIVSDASLFKLTASEKLVDGSGKNFLLKTDHQKIIIADPMLLDPHCVQDQNCILYTKFQPHYPLSENLKALSIKIPNLDSKIHTVYVSGMIANPQGSETYNFWGKKNESVNITIVKDNQVYLRKPLWVAHEKETLNL